MARRKAAKNITICPWLSGRLDCREGRFVQLGNSLLLSKSFQKLTAGAQILYICLTMEAAGKPAVKFSHGAAKKYGIAPTTFDRAIKQLCEAGFVEFVEDDNLYQFATNVYRFSNAWKADPAPHFGEG